MSSKIHTKGRGTFLVSENIGRDRRLSVVADGKGLVGHGGAALLRKCADRVRLIRALSAALAACGKTPGWDRGVVLDQLDPRRLAVDGSLHHLLGTPVLPTGPRLTSPINTPTTRKASAQQWNRAAHPSASRNTRHPSGQADTDRCPKTKAQTSHQQGIYGF